MHFRAQQPFSQPSYQYSRCVNILGIGVSAVNMPDALKFLTGCVHDGAKIYVSVCPVYTLMQGVEHPELKQILNQAGMVTPDGMPLVILSRLKGYRNVRRVYGPDLLLTLSEIMAEHGLTSYYLGGAEGVPERLADTLRSRYPGLKVAGTFSPPFRALTSDEEDQIVEMINEAAPDVVWVGLGSPKQDYWMARYRERLDAPLLIGVGAAFDFLTGRLVQAPKWMQRLALEWLFRLGTEPRRLWRRYLIYNPWFLWKVFLQESGLKRYPLD
jgi:N-acetylglucosaminyldiphosphoundecaprenol N-acetyl-beta-D-mannosaminyltransferase